MKQARIKGPLVKITQEEVVDRQTVLQIELEDEDLDTYLDRGYRRVAQRTAIPGFRKGKAPRAIVERYLGRESLLHEAIDFMLPDVTERAIAAQTLDTTGMPRVELMGMDPVTVKATVALTPEVDLGVYRDLRVEEAKLEVTEEDAQQRLDELRKEAAPWEPVERRVKLGDMVTMDVVGAVEKRSILDEKDAVYVAEEEALLPFPGFSKNLKDMTVAVPNKFDLEISRDHPDAGLAGKQAHFTVTVSEVKERKLPELDDDFAKSMGDGYESLAALREAIEKDLNAEAERAQLAQYREAALDELLKVATVELPPLLLEHEIEHMVERRDNFVNRLNIRMDDYLRYTGKTEDQIQEEMREHAVERLGRSFALTTLAESEGLEVSSEEIDEKVQTVVAAGGEEAESLSGKDLDSEEVKGPVRGTLLMAKALDRLTAIARGEGPETGNDGRSSRSEKRDSKEGGDTVDTQS